jgi:DNA-binding HxlR family transcriptional regulator
MEGFATMAHEVHSPAFCPYYHQATELIGRRWTGAILRALRAGVHRFSDLTACIPDLSDRMLSERLKELEKEGIVVRTVIPDTPVRIDYHLTEKGEALGGVMDAIAEWAHTWVAPQGTPGEERDTAAVGAAAGG